MHHSVEYIYEKLASKYNLPKEAIRQMEFDLWKSIRQEMAKKQGKEILIANLGSFYIDNWYLFASKKSIEYKIQANEEKFKKGELDQIAYLLNWIKLNSILQDNKSMIEGIEKRKNRKKGDRGL